MAEKCKNWKDFLLGIVMLLISVYLLFSPNVVKGLTLLYTDITIAKAVTYVRILGGILLLLSLSLSLRALGLFGATSQEKSTFSIDWLILAGFAALLVYMPLIKLLGFILPSILLVGVFTFFIRCREKQISLRNTPEVLKGCIVSILYAVTLVLLLQFLFTQVLHVRLP
ncbi:MAG: hypothetical protein HFG20_08505 [Anaerotruncus sp.]|nr:hypothetical protein [Anaerotruncus sp.]